MREWIKNRKHRMILYTGILALGLAFCLVYPFSPKLGLRIVYERGLSEQTENQIWFDLGEGYTGTDEVEGLLNLGSDYKNKWFNDYFLMDFDISDYEKAEGMVIFLYRHLGTDDYPIHIQCMEVYNRGICIEKYSPQEIYNRFFIEGVRAIEVASSLNITADPVASPVMTASPMMMEEYNSFAERDGDLRQNLVFSCLFFYGLLLVCDWAAGRLWVKNTQSKLTFDFLDLIALLSLLGVFIMAFGSQPFAHGDEDVLMRGVEFFKSHWLPPDLYGKWALGTFSYGGYTRLGEHTIFYTLAGKIAWTAQFFFHIARDYRVFNVLMWIGLIWLYFGQRQRHPWLALALFTSPQMWYLHTYTLSDTWDLFVTFWIVYELAEEGSLLRRYVKRAYRGWRSVLAFSFCSVLFAMIFMAKANFYIVLLFALIELVRWWFLAERVDRKGMLARYVLIVCGCFFILFAQKTVYEHFAIGFASKGEVNLAEEHAMEGWTPEDYVEKERNPLKQQGRSFGNVLQENGREIAGSLLVTSTGSYAWSTLNAEQWYQTVLLAYYVIMLCCIALYNMREKGRQGMADNFLILFFVITGYLMVVYTCWTSDFQAQGRYIIMLWPITAYYARGIVGMWKNRWFRGCIMASGVLSVYSFYLIGIHNLVRIISA